MSNGNGAKNEKFTAEQFIDAIPGTGGIISTIARRVGCKWHTARKYIDEYSTVKAAYDSECEAVLDVAESVVYGNINVAARLLKDGVQVDSSDAKWLLSKKGKHRGYVERQEVAVSGGGGPIPVALVDYRAGIAETEE